MKRIFLTLTLSFFALSAVAQNEMQGPKREEGKRPCRVIMEACKAAGYVEGGYKTGKGLMKHCMKPLMEGQAVAGVNVSMDDIKACQQKHKERMERRQNMREQHGSGDMPQKPQ